MERTVGLQKMSSQAFYLWKCQSDSRRFACRQAKEKEDKEEEEEEEKKKGKRKKSRRKKKSMIKIRILNRFFKRQTASVWQVSVSM